VCPVFFYIYTATANLLSVVVTETEQGRGIMGVIDGVKPKGVKTRTASSGARAS
jgi:adenosine/AMP kinase